MEPSVNQTFKQAHTFYVEGKIEEAERLYRIILKIQPEHLDANNNLGLLLSLSGRPDEAETILKKVIEFKPDFADAHFNLANALCQKARFKEAEVSYKKAIGFRPNYAQAYNNLGVTMFSLNKLNEGEISFKKAIEFKPDYDEAHFNLGLTFQKTEKFEKAEISYKKAIELKPDYADAYNNLGTIQNFNGDLIASIDSFKQALNIRPDLAEAWSSIFFPLQTIKLQTLAIEDHLPLLDEQMSSKYAIIAKSILSYYLNLGNPSTKNSLDEVLRMLSSADNIFIKNPKATPSKLITESTPPKKITALLHFGRSGTGLLHSLIDGHSDVSTLPSIYFSEFFDHFTWKKIIAGGWEEMAGCFSAIYDVLFDASSPVKVPTIRNQSISNIGQKEGMTTVGPERNEVLSVNKKKFIEELKQLMKCHNHLDQFTFFKLIHSAYEKAIDNDKEKSLIFYHIHNPDMYAQFNFLKLAPDANWLMMIREPLQSCESWIRKSFRDNNYRTVAYNIFQMLFQVDNIIFQNNNSIGVKLEDLKEYPKKTIPAVCDWLGIKEEDSLYQMTAQGKKWWGDPSSPDFTNDGMDPFGKSSINRKLGSIFSKNDKFILSTLFYPFSVHFGYAEENLEQFKNDLLTIRPMLDEMFDFERKIAQNKKINIEKFMKSGPYLFLRSGMIERWNTLNKFHTYPNMLTPLKISQF